MKATEKAYLAGLIDGEGSIMILNPWPLVLAVTISQDVKRMDLLSWVKQHFDSFNDYAPQGRTEGMRTIGVKGVAAKKVLLKLLPYLTVKKPQARLAIGFQILKTERFKIYRHLGEDRTDTQCDILFNATKDMMMKMNKRGEDYTPVAETERENLINLCRAKATLLKNSSSNQEATVHS